MWLRLYSVYKREFERKGKKDARFLVFVETFCKKSSLKSEKKDQTLNDQQNTLINTLFCSGSVLIL